MKYAKAIYAWWRGLSIWIRVPLCIVLIIALIALVVEGAIRFVFPDKTNLRQPLPQTSAEQLESNAEKLEETMGKIDERCEAIKEKINDENDTVRDFEKQVGSADSIDAIDDLIANYSKRKPRESNEQREQREQRERRLRREHND